MSAAVDDDVISAWRPRQLSSEAAEFTRSVVGSLGPLSPARAKALLFACAQLASFGVRVGLPLEQAVLFDQAVIERLARVGMEGLSPASCRTVRTNLRFIGRRVAPDNVAEPLALSRERAKTPYSREEIAAHLGVARCHSSLDRRMRATGLICLGAGAGLMGRELALVTGNDVVAVAGGLCVRVSGTKSRLVPVLAEFHVPLAAAAAHAGEQFVIGGEDPARRNVTTPLVRASHVIHLEPIDTGRLRSYWLAAAAERIGLAEFMAAAGIRCSQRLGDIVAGLRVDPERSVALLGAGS
jgi:hypothetical protein